MLVSTSTRPAQRSPLSVAILMALALSATPAFAADPPAAPAQDGQQADGDKPADKTTDLKAVIVTANKRPEDVMNVASSISVVGEQQIENLNAGQLSDYAAYVPGLQVASDGTPGQTRLALRGIAP